MSTRHYVLSHRASWPLVASPPSLRRAPSPRRALYLLLRRALCPPSALYLLRRRRALCPRRQAYRAEPRPPAAPRVAPPRGLR